MKIIVTTGPSYEPIDEVRRITNFSSGELGVLLSNALAADGNEVFCLKGVSATHPGPLDASVHQLPFTTNDDLLGQITGLVARHEIGALLHVAALADYKVKSVTDERGARQDAAKVESRSGALTIELEPARKVITVLRSLLPGTRIIGWKYELNGTRADALAKAWKQLRENGTDACVVNGRAYGTGFGFCTPPDQVVDVTDKPALVKFLCDWLKSAPPVASGRK
jgi:phosphopantothenate---cysteine ligase (CTP)